MAATARAVIVERFGPPEVMQVGEKPLPPVGEGLVRIAIRAAGVNPSDTYVRLGPEGPYASKPELLPALPYTPGKDGAGEVEEVGPGVDGLKVGDRVYTTDAVTGSYADRAVCRAETVWPLPDNVSFAQGACVGVPCATALYALRCRAALVQGETVFVHGASGAVGLAAVQLAKSMGARLVVGSAGTPAGEEQVRKAGADAVVNHRSEGYLEVAKQAAPGGFDVVLEMFAHKNLPADFGIVARRGRICVIGSRSEPVPVNPRAFLGCEAEVRGVFLVCATKEERRAIHQVLYEEMRQGRLSPVVGSEMPLEDAPRAHREVMNPSSGGASGNIVLLP